MLRPATSGREKFDNGGYCCTGLTPYKSKNSNGTVCWRTDADKAQSIIDDPKYADWIC